MTKIKESSRVKKTEDTHEKVGGYRRFIANISVAFAQNMRATLLLLVGIALLGASSYFVFLQRDGFPEVEVPIGVISTRNFVEDASENNEIITRPIELAIAEIPEVQQVTSTTTEDNVFLIAEFSTDITSDEGITLIRDEIEESSEIPQEIELNYQTFRASSVDGENDMLFTISSDSQSLLAQQEKAEEVARELEKLPEVLKSNVIEQLSIETDANGNEFLFQSAFMRVGLKNGGDTIEFSPAVAIGVVRRNSSVGTLEISDAVREEVESLQEEGVLDGYEVNYGGDFATSLRDSISSLESNALSGFIAVMVISFLFISWRSSVITALFIPTVMAATFTALFLTGNTLNVISLFGLILVLGLLVDDAIVVVEAIDAKRKEGLNRIDSIQAAIQDIGPADISGTVTTLLVFMPMLFITGVLGAFIVLIPLTVIMALILSLLIALTIVPFISGTILSSSTKPSDKRGILDRVINAPSRFVRAIGNHVADGVNFYLVRPILAVFVGIVGIILVVVGFFFAGQLEFNIFPETKDADDLGITISYFPGTEIEESIEIAKEVEDIALEAVEDENIDYITYYYANDTEAIMNIHLTRMADRDVTARDLKQRLEVSLENFEDAAVTPAISSVGPPEEEYQFFMQVFADNQFTLEQSVNEFETYLTNKEIIDGEQVVEVFTTGLDQLDKKDGRRFVEVKAKLSNETDTNLVLELESQVEQDFNADELRSLGLSDDAIEFDKGQESENLESFNSTIFAFGVAMILMYGLLVVQFNSYSQPLLVMFAIPLTFIGLFPGLYVTDNPLSFFVMIGVIGLAGIVVNNTIMLIDFANQSRRSGMNIRDSIVSAVRARFRPLVTTSVTTVAGLLPLALNDPFWESLAFSMIFGLIASTTLVILVFPSYYAIVEKLRKWRTGLFARLGLVDEV